MEGTDLSEDTDTINLATELTVAWLGNPNTRVSSDEVPAFLASVHQALGKLSDPGALSTTEQAPEEYAPAVSVRKSLASPDRIISMIDGKPYASLKRHLKAHGLTPDQYRRRYGLKADYPMVAPGYSEARRDHAKRLGLGRKPSETADNASPEPAAPAAKKIRARTSAAASAGPETTKAPARKRLGISAAKAAAKAHLGGAEDA